MHKTHSHRQVNSVNYLELEQTDGSYTVNDISTFKVYIWNKNDAPPWTMDKQSRVRGPT